MANAAHSPSANAKKPPATLDRFDVAASFRAQSAKFSTWTTHMSAAAAQHGEASVDTAPLTRSILRWYSLGEIDRGKTETVQEPWLLL